MPFDPENPADIKRLGAALGANYKRMEPWREFRTEALREFVGSHYSDEGKAQRVPVNLMEQAVTVIANHLIGSRPSAMVTTTRPHLKGGAARLEKSMNDFLIPEIDLETSLRLAVTDALFGLGAIKVGVTLVRDTEVAGVRHDIGRPFADPISLDDLVMDMCARRDEQVELIGDLYRVPLEFVRESPLFDRKLRKDVKATRPDSKNPTGEDSAAAISGREDGDQDAEYQDHTDLMDVWLPAEKLVLTFAASRDNDGAIIKTEGALRVVNWDGPAVGPYHILNLSPVPDNLMPAAPTIHWLDLHQYVNNLFNKAMSQELASKLLYVNRGGKPDNAKAVQKAKNLDVLILDSNETPLEPLEIGGAKGSTVAQYLQGVNLFDRMAGNLGLLSGTDPGADTARQSELLARNSSTRVRKMQEQVVKWTRGIMRSLAFHAWNDPLFDPALDFSERIDASTTIPVTVRLRDELQGDFPQYEIDIDPVSLQDRSPGARLSALYEYLQNIAGPFLPFFQQQGLGLDMDAITQLFQKLSGTSDLQDIVIGLSNPEAPDEIDRQKPAFTQRTVVRKGRPGASAQGQLDVMAQLAMSDDGEIKMPVGA